MKKFLRVAEIKNFFSESLLLPCRNANGKNGRGDNQVFVKKKKKYEKPLHSDVLSGASQDARKWTPARGSGVRHGAFMVSLGDKSTRPSLRGQKSLLVTPKTDL